MLRINYDKFKAHKQSKKLTDIEKDKQFLKEYEAVLDQREKRSLKALQNRHASRTEASASAKTTIAQIPLFDSVSVEILIFLVQAHQQN